VVNNNCLTTGVDYAEIDLIVVLRPTTSPGLWIQILGRGTRPFFAKGYDLTTIEGRFEAMRDGGKENCLVLDFAGNTARLGPINDPVIPKVKGSKGGTAPVKICELCNTYNHASVRVCDCCGAEFKFKVGIKEEASKFDLIKVDLPIVETFPVDHVTYHEHKKLGGAVSLKVTYFSNLKTFTEYVCFEHTGIARQKAKTWWKERGGDEVPETVLTAKFLVEILKKPTHVRVWINKKYPEIMNAVFN
jgi:DNA repair protein RadD